MPRPFVLVEINDGVFHDSTVVGVVDLEVFVIDWDEIDGNATLAAEKRDEIVGKYDAGDGIDDRTISGVLDRLESIINEGDEYYNEDEEDEGDEDEDTSLSLDDFIGLHDKKAVDEEDE